MKLCRVRNFVGGRLIGVFAAGTFRFVETDVPHGAHHFQDFAASWEHATTTALVLIESVHERYFVVAVISFAGRWIDLASALLLATLGTFNSFYFRLHFRAIFIETAFLTSTVHLDKRVS